MTVFPWRRHSTSGAAGEVARAGILRISTTGRTRQARCGIPQITLDAHGALWDD